MLILLQILLFALPWRARRHVLNRVFGFSIDRGASIGFSILKVRRLEMAAGSRIGHLNFAKGLSLLRLDAHAQIGQLNWITAFPASDDSFFGHLPDRTPVLHLQRHSAITSRHLVDCTGGVEIGEFSTVGGWNTQFISHSFDFRVPRQHADTIKVGRYSFIGSRSILLMGSSFPDKSILSAGSTYGDREGQPFAVYSGVPARKVKDLDQTLGYFGREEGMVW